MAEVEDVTDFDTIDWSEFIRSLIKKTKGDSIHWSRAHQPQAVTREKIVGPAYETEFGDKPFHVRVFRYEYRYYTDIDEFETRDEVAIEFVSSDGDPEWRLPQSPLCSSLLNVVQFQSSNVSEAVRQLEQVS